MCMAEVDDTWKLLRLLDNALNFTLRFLMISAIGNRNKSCYLDELIIFKYWSIKIHQSIEWFSEQMKVFYLFG